ncbi:MAG: GGDEF domain-containing protein, partial [Pseudomonadota bacterium]
VSPMVAFWCYPVSIVTLFVSSRALGRVMTLVGIVGILPCAYVAMETQAFVRFAPTYLMACYFVDLVVGLLDRLQTKLTDLAITDSLTGAYNRRHFDVVLADAVEQHRRGLASVSLLTLDVDHFKHINDRFGHGVGDEVLAGLVRAVTQRVRSIDTLCRVGGEEFALIARGIDESDAIELGESLREHVGHAELLAEMPVTISIGVAQFDRAEDRDDLVRRSDRNLYEAKQRGRNQVWPKATSGPRSLPKATISP